MTDKPPSSDPNADPGLNPSLRQRIFYYYKWFLRNVYPSVNAAYYFSVLAFNLAYLFDNTKYSSPFLWLIGTRIRRLGAADHRAAVGSGRGRARTERQKRPYWERLRKPRPGKKITQAWIHRYVLLKPVG